LKILATALKCFAVLTVSMGIFLFLLSKIARVTTPDNPNAGIEPSKVVLPSLDLNQGLLTAGLLLLISFGYAFLSQAMDGERVRREAVDDENRKTEGAIKFTPKQPPSKKKRKT
jgi:hypothetical protein